MTKMRAPHGWRLAILVLATVLAACGARPDTRPATALSPRRGEDLWAFAPRQAAIGVVLADGAGAAWLDALERWVGIARQEPMGKHLVDQFGARLGGVAVFSEERLVRDGMDLQWGAALFLDAELEPLLAVLPVVDRTAWRRATGARVDQSVDVLPGSRPARCAIVRERYVCAWTGTPGQLVEEAPHASPLAASRSTLPASQRGELDVYAIPAGAVARYLHELAPVVTDVRWVALALRMRPDGLAVDAMVDGKPSASAAAWGSASAPTVDPKSLAGAAGVTRVHFDPIALRALVGTSAVLDGVDVGADLFGQLDGKLVMITRGSGLVAGTARLGLLDPVPVLNLLATACREIEARRWLPAGALVWGGSACTVSYPGMPQATVSFAVREHELVASWAFDEDLKGGGGAVAIAGSPETLASIGDPATVAIWSRGFDLVDALPEAWRENPGESLREMLPVVELASWFGVHAYDAALTATIDENGLRMKASVTTFAGDPVEARAAYAHALERRQQHDWAGWNAALAEIERRHPGTTAAKQAALSRQGYPFVGMNLGFVLGFVTVYNLYTVPPRDRRSP